MKLTCLIIGHNKILDKKHENGYSEFYHVCSQCNKTWFNEQLSEKPKIQNTSSKQKTIKTNYNQNSAKKTTCNFYAM